MKGLKILARAQGGRGISTAAVERLAFHQEHSQPVMDQLQSWMQEQFEQKRVEPNSGLGEAINYMLKRWTTLTRSTI